MNHTVLSANYTMSAFTPQPQSITVLWLVLILPSHRAPNYSVTKRCDLKHHQMGLQQPFKLFKTVTQP